MRERIAWVGFCALGALVVPSQAFGAPSLEGATCLEVLNASEDGMLVPDADDAVEVDRLVGELQLVGPGTPLSRMRWRGGPTQEFHLRLRDGSEVWLALWLREPFNYAIVDDVAYDCASSNVAAQLLRVRLAILQDAVVEMLAM